MRKFLSVLTVFLAICLLFSACIDRDGGMTFYPFGVAWETDGNAVSVLSATIVEQYSDPDGCCVYSASEGEILLMVTCRAAFAEKWHISTDTELSGNSYDPDETPCKLRWDPIPVSSDGVKQGYILLFCLDADTFSGKISDYHINMVIKQSDVVQRTQHFLLSN